MNFMKAQVITAFGEASVFKYNEVQIPQLTSGTVLIKVLATSVNPIDCKIRAGAVPDYAPEFPAILHGDVAGIIVSIGTKVTKFKPGDEVFGYAGGVRGCHGALCEYMVADEKLLAKKPKNLSMRQSAALPLVSITAWEALFRKAKLHRRDHILIHGGIGGVGHVALQLAKACGATVSTTVLKEADFELAKFFHADNVINAREEAVQDYVKRLTNGLGFDIVFDTVGGPNLDRSFEAAKFNGTVVTTAARSTHDLTILHNKGLSLHAVFTLLPLVNNRNREEYGDILTEVTCIADEGKLKPLVDEEYFSLESVSKAHEYLEAGKARGKVVIEITR